jgi:hypothetical protein
MSKTWKDIADALAAPFPKEEVHWRIQSAGKGQRGPWARILCYIDARNDYERLDSVLGSENWSNNIHETASGRVIQEISIRLPGTDEWITKSDGAGDTAVEREKGAISDAFKRACVLLGPGRYLYGAGDTWAVIGGTDADETPYKYTNEEYRKTKGKSGLCFWWGVPESAWKALGYDEAPRPVKDEPPEQEVHTISENSAPKTLMSILQPVVGSADVSEIDLAIEDLSGRRSNTAGKEAGLFWLKKIREMTEETNVEKRRVVYAGIKGGLDGRLSNDGGTSGINQTTADMLLAMAADHGKALRDRDELEGGFKSRMG